MSTETVKDYTDLNVKEIKALYADLKKARTIMTWGEFAGQIESDRTYISRVMNGHEPLTRGLQKKIFEKFINTTKNVSRETKIPKDRTDELIESLKNTNEMLVEVIKNNLNIIQSNLTTNQMMINSIQVRQSAQHHVMLESLDRIEKKKEGTLSAKADKIEVELSQKLKRKGNHNAVDSVNK